MAKNSKNRFRYSPIVAILGGCLSNPKHQEFAKTLGVKLQSQTQFRLCVSGFKGETRDNLSKFHPSFGYQSICGAISNMTDHEATSRILTRRNTDLPTQRNQFAIGNVKNVRGQNTTSRGLSIISESDLVCLGAGGTGIKKYYEFARAIDKPVLPLPCFGLASEKLWDKHHNDLADEFGEELLDLLSLSSIQIEKLNSEEMSIIADKYISAMRTCVRIRCLVLMPFANKYNWIFESIIDPACQIVGVDAVRLDIQARTGDIALNFKEELKKAHCVIAAITENNSNVMYEIGFTHASNVPIILLTNDQNQGFRLPLYLNNHRKICISNQNNKKTDALSSQELEKLLSGIRKVAEFY